MPIDSFVRLCKMYGSQPEEVQSGGGNVSVKTSRDSMIIKASGTNLKNVNEKEGYAEVNFQSIINFYANHARARRSRLVESEAYGVNLSAMRREENGVRPSMETGFHAMLDEVVLHTHSIYVNSILCAVEGRDIVSKIFRGSENTAFWVPYVSPGFQLSKYIFKLCQRDKPRIILLQNHGVVVSAESELHAIELFSFTENRFKLFIKQVLGYIPEWPVSEGEEPGGYVFPDQVIYEGKSTEVNRAVTYISSTINKLKLNLNLISQREANYLRQMESEKYRMELTK